MPYDVFVSHNKLSKPWVRRFVNTLRSQKISTFFDEENILPGAHVVRALDEALVASKFVVLIITPASLESDWVAMESAITIQRDPINKNRTLIPVILEKVDKGKIQPSVQQLNWVSLYEPASRTRQLEALLKAVGVADAVASTIAETFIWGEMEGLEVATGIISPESVYVQKRTRDIIINNFPKTLCDLDDLWASPELSFSALIARANIFYPNLKQRFVEALSKARDEAYDYKYAKLTRDDDERSLDLDGWESELFQLRRMFGMEDPRHMSILNVGIGNGREWAGFYSAAKRIVGVDVSTAALQSAAEQHTSLETMHADAADLSAIANASFDVYLSLRTYQSTLFDIEGSVLEAARILNANGLFVASLSDAHLAGKRDKRIIRGILKDGSNQADRNHPYNLADRVRRALYSSGFTHVGIRTGLFEIYVYGRRSVH